MMSEHKVVVQKQVDVEIGWTEVFSCATELLGKTGAADVRWVHVERAKAIYDGMRELFELKSNSGKRHENPIDR